MKIKEVTKTIIVRTDYIADDGAVFNSEEACKQYEESAMFQLRKSLKVLNKKPISGYDITGETAASDCTVEIFDIQTEDDLNNLKEYLVQKMIYNQCEEEALDLCFYSNYKGNEERKGYTFDGVTVGHEVMIFWNRSLNWFWVYRDGSIKSYLEFFKDRIDNLIK